MRHRVDGGAGLEGGHEAAGVDGGRPQDGVGQALAAELGQGLVELLDGLALDGDLAHEGVAVGVDAGGRQAQDDVAGLDLIGADHLGAVDDAHHEAGQIVVVRVHDAGVLGHLAAHEGAAGLLAALGDALDDLCHVLGAELSDGHVIQEEERLGTDGHHVVDAHGHEVLAHCVVTVEQLGDGELGADAVGAGHEDGVLHVLEALHREARAEAAEAADDLGAVGGLDGALDGVDRAGALVDVHAGVGVRNVLGLLSVGHVSSPCLPSRGRPRGASSRGRWRPQGCWAYIRGGTSPRRTTWGSRPGSFRRSRPCSSRPRGRTP